ncbi:MAG: hypothetical protein OXB84_08725, partial [Halobacteriovoraceae bacterium]|nr:hypothetical protein [Halobacteriovoraceae bacterium]
ANLKGISISTVRRSIKANKVKYKKSQGKFFIYVHSDKLNTADNSMRKLQMEKEILKNKLRKLEEENNDLKMLVFLYEKNKPSVKSSDISP